MQYREISDNLNIFEYILKLLNDNGEMSRQELEDATNYRKTWIVKVLDELKKDGKVVRKGKSRGVKYSTK